MLAKVPPITHYNGVVRKKARGKSDSKRVLTQRVSAPSFLLFDDDDADDS